MLFAYHYVARSKAGDISGLIYAERSVFARSRLGKMGLKVRSIRFAPVATLLGQLHQDFDLAELADFYRLFARIEKQGDDREIELTAAVMRVSDLKLRAALATMADAVGGAGMPVHAAMRKAGFPARDCDLIENLETKTSIDVILEELAEDIERRLEVARSVSKMVLLPTIMYFVMAGLMLFSIVWVSPRVARLFTELFTNVELPEGTQRFYDFCALFNNNMVLSIPMYVAAVLAVFSLIRSKFVFGLVEYLGFVRRARVKADYARLWSSFSLLNSAGVQHEEAFAGLSRTASTAEAKACFSRLRAYIGNGLDFDDAITQAQFPAYIVNAMASAYRTSSLTEGSRRLSNKLLRDLADFSEKAKVWIGVAITVAVAGCVLLFASVTVIPIFTTMFKLL